MRNVAVIAAATVALLGCAGPTVVRVVDGRELPGRFVSARAYSLYAHGADAEARGDRANARLDYLAAADEDDSVEIWTRIGAVSCALGRADDARRAFARAAAHADDYEPLYRERAACTLAGRLDPAGARAAFEDASRALALDPNSEETVLLYARAAEAAGEGMRAERALRELCARSPGRMAGWQALRAFAGRHGDEAAAARATAALGALGTLDAAADRSGPAHQAVSRNDAVTIRDLDAALSRDALAEARSAATRARLPPAELAVRAAALGRAQIAKAQAELVHRTDPTNTSAAIALAVACDLLRDDEGVVSALASASALTTPPSPLARLLFAELIARRTDEAAARAWLGPITPPPADADALLRAVAARLAARLRP